MSEQQQYVILLVAGDYEIIQQVSHSLSGPRFDLQRAYSHRDALYLLTFTTPDLIIVDAAMVNPHDGSNTVNAMKALDVAPLLALALDRTALNRAQQARVRTMQSLEATAVRSMVAEVLEIALDKDTAIFTDTLQDPEMAQQAEQVNTLFALARSLTEVLDLNEVLNRIVESARSLTRAEEGMLLLPEGDELYLRARVGMDIEVARNFRVKTRDSLAGHVYQDGTPILIGDSGPQKVKTEYFVNSLLYVPVLLHGGAIGVLGVMNRTKEDSFTEQHERLLVNLASFAAIAIQNARVHNDSLARNRDLELLINAGQQLNTSMSLADALGNTCTQLADVLKVGYVRLMNWDRERDVLQTTARYDHSSWPIERGPVIELGYEAELNAALKTGGEHPNYLWLYPEASAGRMVREEGGDALLIVPVWAGEQLLGVVRVFFVRRPPAAFSGDVADRVRSSALQAIADLLNSTQRGISSNMASLIRDILETSGGDWCDLSLPIRGDNALSVMVRMGQAVWTEDSGPAIDLAAFEDLRNVLVTDGKLRARIDDTTTSAGARQLLRLTNTRSLLAIPMEQRGQVVGVVLFGANGADREFTDRDMALARALLGQAAVALENARLFNDLEASVEELQTTQNRMVQTARLSAMGELAAVVAHQMNNPLTTIIVDTELMLMDEPPDSPRRDALEAIIRTGKRAANVARRLLAIARPIDLDAEPDYVDVIDSIQGIVSLLQVHFEHANIRLTTDFPKQEVPPVKVVKGRLDDIWLNLLMNAYDALFERGGGQVGVEAAYEAETGMINVRVWDDGPGIPPEIQERVFSPFFTTKPAGEGTGLGLHISREMIEDVGGQISFESTPGKNTCFVVQLPVLEREKQQGQGV